MVLVYVCWFRGEKKDMGQSNWCIWCLVFGVLAQRYTRDS